MNVHERTLRRVRHRLHDVDYGDMGEFQELEYLEQLLELVGAVFSEHEKYSPLAFQLTPAEAQLCQYLRRIREGE